jgi:hypothetical protein
MRSTVKIDIDVPQAELAELFADPRNSTLWMDDLDRIEPISGDLGESGSSYRLIPKRGMTFVATVVKRSLPEEVRLYLRGPRVSMRATDRFVKLSERRTRLISREDFAFEGLLGKVKGWLVRRSIVRAHRRHMKSFRRFAESM